MRAVVLLVRPLSGLEGGCIIVLVDDGAVFRFVRGVVDDGRGIEYERQHRHYHQWYKGQTAEDVCYKQRLEGGHGSEFRSHKGSLKRALCAGGALYYTLGYS